MCIASVCHPRSADDLSFIRITHRDTTGYLCDTQVRWILSRPGFTEAAHPEIAEPLFERVVDAFKQTGLKVETGEFGAMMSLELTNEGPVTIMLDTDDRSKPRRG